MIRLIVVALMVSALLGCQQNVTEEADRFELLPDTEAGDIVKKAIAKAGGWDNWTSKENFSFYKKITYVDSTGQIERTIKQKHTYQLKNGFKARLEWKVGEDDMLIINNGTEAKKYKNGLELTDEKSIREAWNSSYGSHYVIGIPYKLTDPGVSLTYEGIDSITLDRPVHSLKVDYAEGAGSSGGLHQWNYYFDIDDYDLAGNYLDYGNGHSITTYEVFEQVSEHRLHNKRFSYIANDQKERVVLRTIYENEEPKFNNELATNTFELL